MQVVLILCEALPCLKVNFCKSLLLEVSINVSLLNQDASIINCRVGTLPFVYLGVSIGDDTQHMKFWEALLNRLKNRQSRWESGNISMGGWMVFLKIVLSAIHVYACFFLLQSSLMYHFIY